MKLGDKIRHLREVEGTLRGLGRAMTQSEVARAVQEELGETLSQSYLSQIESGARPHLTGSTRSLLSRFFQVHPGHLVDDPEGYHTELVSDLRTREDSLDSWLAEGCERFSGDQELSAALRAIAGERDSRVCLLLLESILAAPGLRDRLMQVLRPAAPVSERNLE